MVIKKNGVSVNLTESDLNRITNKVLSENDGSSSSKGPSIEDLVKRIEKLEMEVLQIKKR
jgi:hypothetical protein